MGNFFIDIVYHKNAGRASYRIENDVRNETCTSWHEGLVEFVEAGENYTYSEGEKGEPHSALLD